MHYMSFTIKRKCFKKCVKIEKIHVRKLSFSLFNTLITISCYRSTFSNLAGVGTQYNELHQINMETSR